MCPQDHCPASIRWKVKPPVCEPLCPHIEVRTFAPGEEKMAMSWVSDIPADLIGGLANFTLRRALTAQLENACEAG